MSLSEAMVQELQYECAITKKLLERVPEDKLEWKPHDKSMPQIGMSTTDSAPKVRSKCSVSGMPARAAKLPSPWREQSGLELATRGRSCSTSSVVAASSRNRQ